MILQLQKKHTHIYLCDFQRFGICKLLWIWQRCFFCCRWSVPSLWLVFELVGFLWAGTLWTMVPTGHKRILNIYYASVHQSTSSFVSPANWQSTMFAKWYTCGSNAEIWNGCANKHTPPLCCFLVPVVIVPLWKQRAGTSFLFIPSSQGSLDFCTQKNSLVSD